MVRHKQPCTLYRLCHRRFCQYLGDKVVRAGYDGANATLSAVRLKLRPFFVEHIPVAVRTSLLEETTDFLYAKSQPSSGGVDCFDYGRSVLYLLHLLLSKEIRRLKVTLCCYYGCRDLEGVLRCIKKNGSSLEHLELSRTSLLRMDQLLFRNVLTAASSLTSLVVKNICSDAMLKLIGTHCYLLQYLDISCSKQVSDVGIESLCCQVQIRDKSDLSTNNSEPTNSVFLASNGNNGSSMVALHLVEQGSAVAAAHHHRLTVQEDFGDSRDNSVGCLRYFSWKDLRQRLRHCLCYHATAGGASGCAGGMGGQDRDGYGPGDEILVEVKQVLQPLCATLCVFDIADTSVTNVGLLIILRKMTKVHSLGEYNVSENFLRSLCVVSSLRMDKFGLYTLHARKISNVGMYNMVHVFPAVKSFTCWEPQFDLTDLAYFCYLRQLTLLRIAFTEAVLHQLIRFIETCHTYCHHHVHGVTTTAAGGRGSTACKLEKLSLEFVLQDEFMPFIAGAATPMEFDIGRIFKHCDNLKIFTVEFKDSLLRTPPVGYAPPLNLSSLSTLVHVQLGQVVQNNAVAAVLHHCPRLRHLHCNNCPDLHDLDLASCVANKSTPLLECFYIYEAPHLTVNAFQLLLDGFPLLHKFGNLTRWAVNCEGIQQVVRTLRDNNVDVEILCGSHWFSSNCSQSVHM